MVCAAILLVGCAAAPPRSDDLYLHAIRIDEDGHSVDPRNGKPLAPKAATEQFDSILNAIDAEMAKNPDEQILMFVHGGLTPPDSALDSAAGKIGPMEKANYYPLFVIWDSSLDATYKEHLFQVRQGHKDADTKWSGQFTWPIYLGTDLLRSAARAPMVWLQQRHTDDQAIGAALDSMFTEAHAKQERARSHDTAPTEHAQAWMSHPHNIEALSVYLDLNQRYYDDWSSHGHHATTQLAISIGTDESQFSDWVGRGFNYTVTIPFKMFFAPLIDALGSAAWQDMSRRTQTIVEGSDDFAVRRDSTRAELDRYIDNGTDGGLDRFTARLAARARGTAGRAPGASTRPYQLTLIGHSMGTMVLNELLRRQRQRETADGGDASAVPVTNIVYMAAACTVRDFRDSVIPFMEEPNHRGVRFYNLSLHPTAELLETNDGDLPPRGSLLCWIDDFLSEPATPMDCTLGRWVNLVGMPYVIPPELRGRCSIKAFDLLRDPDTGPGLQDPQRHGDFTSCNYWDPHFWEPLDPVPPAAPRVQAALRKQQEMQMQRVPVAKSAAGE
jgi:hypothetical protein